MITIPIAMPTESVIKRSVALVTYSVHRSTVLGHSQQSDSNPEYSANRGCH